MHCRPPGQSAGVPQSGGDPAYRAEKRPGRRLLAGAIPAQELDLNRVHRVDIRIPEPDRALQDGMAVEELPRLDDPEHARDSALVLSEDRSEEPLAIRRGRDELEVALGDLEARLGEGHLE